MSNAEAYALKSLHKNTKELLNSIKQLFGARWMDGYHEMSLKSCLNDILRTPRAAIFKTDRGSRYGTASHNARAIVIYKTEVQSALKNARDNEPHAKKLKKALEENWNAFGLTCAAFSLLYYLVFSPFHAIVSKNVPWKEVKAVIIWTKEKLESFQDSETCPFKIFQTAISREDVSEKTSQLFHISTRMYENADSKQRRFIQNLVRDMTASVLVKFDKDTKGLLKASIDDDKKLPWTNRRAESSFSHLKQKMLENKNLGDEKYVELGQAAVNRLADWLNDKVNKFCDFY